MDHRIVQISDRVLDGHASRADLRGRLTSVVVIVASLAIGLIVLGTLVIGLFAAAEVVLQILVHLRLLT